MIRLEIWNDGTGSTAVGNYNVMLDMPRYSGTVRVEGFERSRGAVALLREAVAQLAAAEFELTMGEIRLSTIAVSHDCADAVDRLEEILR